MIHIEYALSSHWNAAAAGLDLRTAGATELRYRFFMGDILLAVGATDLSARWGWVPVLDAALAFRSVAQSLRGGCRESHFEFTDSAAVITFLAQDDGQVCISASYASGHGCTPVEEFCRAVDEFARRAFADAIARHPVLNENHCVARWLTELGRGSDGE